MIGVLRTSLLVVFAAALAACVTEPLHPLDVEQAVTARVAAGVAYLRKDNPSEARRHFTRALSLDPQSPAANNAMALLYGYEGDTEGEERYYQRALDADPAFAPALNNYGALLFSQARYQEAAGKLERAAAVPDYQGRSGALSNLGLCYQALEQPDLARQAFARALRLRPGMAVPSRELARIDYQRKQYQAGWRHFQQYSERTRVLDADSLWLGIRLASAVAQPERLASFELALQSRYPQSDEYRRWQQWKNNQERW